MRRISAAVVAALLLSIGALGAAEPPAADDDSPPAPAPWHQRVFGGSKPKPVEKKAPAEKPPTREEVAKSLALERNSFFDRLKYCDRLRQIALSTGDETLTQKAEALEKLAWDVYVKKTSSLESILERVKAAEISLEEKRNWGTPAGSAWNQPPARAANGRPLVNRESNQ